MKTYFTTDTDAGYTAEQAAAANACANRLLAEWGDPDGTDPDNVKNAISAANDAL